MTKNKELNSTKVFIAPINEKNKDNCIITVVDGKIEGIIANQEGLNISKDYDNAIKEYISNAFVYLVKYNIKKLIRLLFEIKDSDIEIFKIGYEVYSKFVSNTSKVYTVSNASSDNDYAYVTIKNGKIDKVNYSSYIMGMGEKNSSVLRDKTDSAEFLTVLTKALRLCLDYDLESFKKIMYDVIFTDEICFEIQNKMLAKMREKYTLNI